MSSIRQRGGLALIAGGLLGVLAGSWCGAQSLQPVPKLEARVVDLTGTLTAIQQSMLEEKLQDFEARKGSQLAVLIVPTTQPEEIEPYSVRVFDQWKLGRKGVDDGALLIIAKEDRAVWITVGRGLEGALTDVTASRIVAETITPLFRQGDFFGGINAGLDQMIRVADGEPLPPPDRRWQGRPQGIMALLPFLFVGVLIGAPILRTLFGRAVGSVLTGTVTGVLLAVAGQALAIAILIGFIALMFSLLGGFGGPRGWSSSPRSSGWGGGWGGGFGGGGFGGGGLGGGLGGGGFGGGRFGGGGGFTGGGGTTAGGGAGGHW
jgi:uncharacterized protein